jgi:oxygen-dependent protoporphyrinogen oxidase
MKNVVIIGGGITGLSTAYYLQQRARRDGVSIRCLVLEKDEKLGGKIQTENIDGFVLEKGPDSFLARKTAATDLCRELGLEGELVGTNPNARKTYILHKGKLHRLPPGTQMGIPTQFGPFATTGLLSVKGKARALMDLVLPRNETDGDQSLGGFLARRLGDEVLEAIAEPLLAGIYAGDARKLSLRATFPQFEMIEKKYRSLILGILAQKRAVQSPSSATKHGSVFLTVKSGLGTIVKRLTEELGAETLRTKSKVTQITARMREERFEYTIHLDHGEHVPADAVVITTPAFSAAEIFPHRDTISEVLQQIPYVSVATIVLAFPQDAVSFPLDGTGFVVPRKEGRTITACTWVSSKWLHTAPEGHKLLRCYVGRAGDEAIVDRPEEEIIAKVRQDLSDIMGITSEPLFTRLTRWKQSMPQYTVGHLNRLQEIETEIMNRWPGLLIAGAGYKGLGVPDCILEGKKTAEQVLEYILQKRA